jgi:hypothetical protein
MNMVNPVSALAYSPPPSQPIDETKVQMAERRIAPDVPITGSALADVLRNPNLNQAERDRIIHDLAQKGASGVAPFYANDASRMQPGQQSALGNDQSIIANAVQQAYADGAINKDDLVRIADFNQVGNGAQRFMDILQQGSASHAPGSAAETLANSLWSRNGNGGADKAVAALYYMSDPSQQRTHLGTPEARQQAFEALVKFNDTAFKGLEGIPPATLWKDEALGAEGRLFMSDSQGLIDHYTAILPVSQGGGTRTEVLSKFISQTVLNPDAQGLALDHSRDLVPAVTDAIGSASDTFLSRAQHAPPGSLDQHIAMEQFGRMDAAISGGSALALQNYNAKIQANNESRRQFADLVGTLAGKVVGKVVDVPNVPGVGNPAEQVGKKLGEQLFDVLFTNKPAKPAIQMASFLHGQYESRVDELRKQINQPDLMEEFAAGYSDLLDLQQKLHVDVGAQVAQPGGN